MFKDTHAFSGFSVKDLTTTKEFYNGVLGLDVSEDAMGLMLNIADGNPIFVYNKEDHVPAIYTILNFPVENIDDAVQALKDKGVVFEHYEMNDSQDIMRGLTNNHGPDIAWFKDPSGNILSVLQQAS